MNTDKYFKATLIDHSDEEAIYNTFSCYFCLLALLIAVESVAFCIVLDIV